MATSKTFEQIQKEISDKVKANPGSIWLMGEGVVFPTKEMARNDYVANKNSNWINEHLRTIQHCGTDYYQVRATNVWD